MRKVINEPGFWMMVFTLLMLAMFLFAPSNGDCASPVKGPAVRYMVEVEKYHDSGWQVGGDMSDVKWKMRYHHYVQTPGKLPVLVLTTDEPPNLATLIQSLHIFHQGGTAK